MNEQPAEIRCPHCGRFIGTDHNLEQCRQELEDWLNEQERKYSQEI